MRITQNMLNTQLMQDLNKNLQRLSRNQEQLSSGLKVNRASDDPVATTSILRYREDLVANEQYRRNAEDAMSYLENLDSVLNQANSILQRARELAVEGANGSNPPQALEAIAREVAQLYEELIAVGNSQFKGKYLFNGEMTDTAPYGDVGSGSGPHLPDHSGAMQFEVAQGVLMTVNLDGKEVFGNNSGSGSDNAFDILNDLKNALSSGNLSEINAALGRLDGRIDKVLHRWGEVGARVNRLELTQKRLTDTDLNLQTLLSKAQDTDVAKAIMELKMSEQVYTASLSAGARIIQPSLVDFLR